MEGGLVIFGMIEGALMLKIRLMDMACERSSSFSRAVSVSRSSSEEWQVVQTVMLFFK